MNQLYFIMPPRKAAVNSASIETFGNSNDQFGILQLTDKEIYLCIGFI